MNAPRYRPSRVVRESRLSDAAPWYKRLVDPSRDLPESLHRRAHLLGWLLLFLLVLTFGALVLVLVLGVTGKAGDTRYAALIAGLFALCAVGYLLNRRNRYYCAAGVTVSAAVLAPWLSLALDPRVLAGDPVPLAYIAIAILLASILLPLYGAVAVAVIPEQVILNRAEHMACLVPEELVVVYRRVIGSVDEDRLVILNTG